MIQGYQRSTYFEKLFLTFNPCYFLCQLKNTYIQLLLKKKIKTNYTNNKLNFQIKPSELCIQCLIKEDQIK